MRFAAVALSLLVITTTACRKQANDNAPTQENPVFAMEYANATFGWRADGHRIYILFTDEATQIDAGQQRWLGKSFCDRFAAGMRQGTINLIWSGKTKGGSPDVDEDKRNENPKRPADCTHGTYKAIKDDASDLDLTNVPITTALAAGALVEYISKDASAANTIKITIKTAASDGAAEFAVQNPASTDVDTSNADDADLPANPTTPAPTPVVNNLTPKAAFSHIGRNPNRIRVNLLGLIDPATGAAIPYVAQDSVFLSENGEPRGIKVQQSVRENRLPVDLVFVVDNSGSMGEEADHVADKIAAFADLLDSRGLDIRFGVVGFLGDVTGAINLAKASDVDAYLKRAGQTGTNRTVGFAGSDAKSLEDQAKSFDIKE